MEVWKGIKGFEGKYEVSNEGRVRSLDRLVPHSLSKSGVCLRKGKLLTGVRETKGYLRVKLEGRVYKIHRLVASSFIPNLEGKPQVNHKNGIKDDNRAENLEWCTNSENLAHAYSIGLKCVKGEKAPSVKLSNHKVKTIRKMYNSGSKIPLLADIYNVSRETIRDIVKMKTWKEV